MKRSTCIDDHPGLGPPRFSLATMLGVVGTLCLVMASYTWFGASGAALFGLFTLAVLAHVIGNWLGTQLRDLGDQTPRLEPAEGLPAQKRPELAQVEHHYAPSTSLRDPWRVSRKTKITVVVGSLSCGIGGSAILALLHWRETSWISLVLAAIALAVLGAMASFFGLCFVQAGWNALTEASRHR